MPEFHSEKTVRLFEAILSLNTVGECEDFFQDLCTVNELQAMTQRFEIADELDKGKTFAEIEADTGVSSATISRVNRSFQYGSGGYAAVLAKRKGKETE